jgi:TolB-like protein
MMRCLPVSTASRLRPSLRAAAVLILIAIALLPSGPASALAQGEPPNAAPTAAPPPPSPTAPAAPAPAAALTLAVLDFECADKLNPHQGREIAEVIAAMLAGRPGLRIVDRQSLNRVIEEQATNLTGLVQGDQAVRIGQLVGAKLIVTGRSFMLGDKTFVTARIVGVETSLVEGVLVRGDGPLDELTVELAEKVAAKIAERGRELVAAATDGDPVPALIAQLHGRQKPVLAILVAEHHVAAASEARTAGSASDPAVESEIKKMLLDAGFQIVDLPQNDLADWASAMQDGRHEPWPRSLREVDLVVTGKAFSEFGARIGNLVSCSARAEINVIQRSDGRIVLADRTTAPGVHLQEQIAGKTALQNAGRTLGLHLLQHFAATLPQAAAVESVSDQ